MKLAADYGTVNIGKILKRGTELGLVYYDQVWGERYEDSPILNAEQAVTKVIQALESKADEGPCVFTKIGETYGNLFFFKSNENVLTFSMSGFCSPKKIIIDGTSYVDFAYYVRLALDLCKDFAILELKTDRL